MAVTEATVTSTTAPPLAQCDPRADVVFLLDASSSVTDQNWQDELSFVVNIVSRFVLGPEDVQVGVATFSSFALRAYRLGVLTDQDTFAEYMGYLTHSGGSTATYSGLDLVRKEMLTLYSGARPDASHIVILLTDGESDDTADTILAADLLKATGATIVSVGVGDINEAELRAVASSNLDVFFTPGFEALHRIELDVGNRTCDIPDSAVTPPTTQSTSPQHSTLPPTQCDVLTDLVFLMDSSESLWPDNWHRAVAFAISVVNRLYDGPTSFRVAAVTFSSHAEVAFGLGDFSELSALVQALSSVKYLNEGTSTYKGLDLIWTAVFNLNTNDSRDIENYKDNNNLLKNSPHSQKVVIALTDGASNNGKLTQAAASRLKGEGVTLLAVGVGDRLNQTELEAMASSPRDVFLTTGSPALNRIEEILGVQACQGAESTTEPSSPEATSSGFTTDSTAADFVTEPHTESTTDFTTESTLNFTSDPTESVISEATSSRLTGVSTAVDFITEPNTESTADFTTGSSLDFTSDPTFEHTTANTSKATTNSTTSESLTDPNTLTTTETPAESTTESSTESTPSFITDPTTELSTVTRPSREPTHDSSAKPTTVSTAESTMKPTPEPTVASTSKPNIESTTQVTSEANTESTIENTSRSTTKFTLESTTVSTHELTTESIGETTQESTSLIQGSSTEATNGSFIGSTTEFISDSTTDIISKSTTESRTEPTTEPSSETTTESTMSTQGSSTNATVGIFTDSTTEFISDSTTDIISKPITESTTELTTESSSEITAESTHSSQVSSTDATIVSQADSTTGSYSEFITKSTAELTTESTGETTPESTTFPQGSSTGTTIGSFHDSTTELPTESTYSPSTQWTPQSNTSPETSPTTNHSPGWCTTADVILVIDSSGSVVIHDPLDYQRLLNFSADVARHLLTRGSDVRVGALLYDSTTKRLFDLHTYSTVASVEHALRTAPYLGGGSDTANALNTIGQEMFGVPSGGRPGASKVVLLTLEGPSKNELDTISAANRLKTDLSAHIVAVGVANAKLSELEGVASSPADVVTVYSFRDLRDVTNHVADLMCKAPILNVAVIG